MPNSQFCPECGAGVDAVESAKQGCLVVRLPLGYPFDAPCQTCERTRFDRIAQAGTDAALLVESAVFAELMREPSPPIFAAGYPNVPEPVQFMTGGEPDDRG